MPATIMATLTPCHKFLPFQKLFLAIDGQNLVTGQNWLLAGPTEKEILNHVSWYGLSQNQISNLSLRLSPR
jgi:hypothetical protein